MRLVAEIKKNTAIKGDKIARELFILAINLLPQKRHAHQAAQCDDLAAASSTRIPDVGQRWLGARRRTISISAHYPWADMYEAFALLEPPKTAFGPTVNYVARAKRLNGIVDSENIRNKTRNHSKTSEQMKPHNRRQHITEET